MDKARMTRVNTILMIVEGTLFWTGLSFLQGDTVISTFIDVTTGSVALAGLAATLRSMLWLVGQFIAGMFVHKIKVQRKAMRLMGFIGRPLMLLMVPILLMGVTGRAAGYLFLLLYGLFFFMDGIVGLFWMEVNTRTLPPRQRGAVSSLSQTTSGIAGIFVGVLLQFVLGNSMDAGQKYAIVFGLSGLVMVIDMIVLAQFKDVEHVSFPERPIPNLPQYIKSLIPLFTQNPAARKVLYARMLYTLTMISGPTNALFARHMGGLDDSLINALVFMPVLGQIIGGVFWAQSSRKLTFPIMMCVSELIGVFSALMNILCFILATRGLPVMVPLSITMVLISVNVIGYVGYSQQLISVVDDINRPQYFVLSALVLAPLSLGTYFAGLIVEHFGYLPVYFIMLIAGVAGAWLVWDSFLKK